MLSPSVDVGDDLRLYARQREEEMRKRVEAYRETRERELRDALGEEVKNFETTKLILENRSEFISEGNFLDEIKKMCHRLTNRIETLISNSPQPVLEDNDDLLIGLQSELDRVRFEIECEILAFYDRLTNDIRTVRVSGRESIQDHIDSRIASLHKDLIDVAQQIRNQKEETWEERKLERARLEDDLENIFSKVSADLSRSFGGEVDSLVKHVTERLDGNRRRLMLTLEKRIVDLSTAQFPMRNSDLELYRSELGRLLLRYLEHISPQRSGRSSPESLGSIEASMNANNVPHKYRVKFILSFVEKFNSPELMACLADSLGRRDDKQIVSLRS